MEKVNFSAKINMDTKSKLEEIREEMMTDGKVSNADIVENLVINFKPPVEDKVQELEDEITSLKKVIYDNEIIEPDFDMSEGISFDDIEEIEEDKNIPFGKAVREYNELMTKINSDFIEAESIEETDLSAIFLVVSKETQEPITVAAARNLKKDLAFLVKAMRKGKANADMSDSEFANRYGKKVETYQEFRHNASFGETEVKVVSLAAPGTIEAIKILEKYTEEGVVQSKMWPLI